MPDPVSSLKAGDTELPETEGLLIVTWNCSSVSTVSSPAMPISILTLEPSVIVALPESGPEKSSASACPLETE